MNESGYLNKILLGMDMGPRTMWKAYGGGPGMTYLITKFLPKLLKAGLSKDHIETIMYKNPAYALAITIPGESRL
jgi:phosphotriesterase-related protein